MIGGVRVAIAVLTVCGACAPARPPVAPNTNLGVSFHDFTESFNLSPETNADPKLGSSNVKRAPDGAAIRAIQDGFHRWCDSNGGQWDGSEPFQDAGVEYLDSYIARHPKLEGIIVNAVTCLDREGAPMGGYLNVGNADVAFFDKVQVAAFVRAYPAGPAKARREQNGKLKPEVDHNREIELKANLAQCEKATGKKCVERWGNGRTPWVDPVE